MNKINREGLTKFMKRSVIKTPPPWIQASKITTTLLYKIILKSWGKEDQNLYDSNFKNYLMAYKKSDGEHD